MADTKSWTSDETVAAVNEVSRKLGDNWRIRVMRRRAASLLPEPFLTLDGGSVTHAAAPETWLPAVLNGGGGIFELSMYHQSDPTTPVGGVLRFSAEGAPKEPDLAQVFAKEWIGPKTMVYPRMDPNVASFSFRSPPTPEWQAGNGAMAQAATQLPVSPSIASAFSGLDPHSHARLLAAEDALARRQREMDDREQRNREDAMRRDYDLKLQAVEARAVQAAQAATQRPATPPTDIGTIITTAVAAVSPIVTAMMNASAEARREQSAMLTTILARPAVPPEVKDAMDKLAQAALAPRDDSGAGAKLTANMAEAMGSMTNTMLSVLHTASEFQSPGEPAEPGWVKAVREVVRGFAAMMNAQAQAAQAAAGVPQRRVATQVVMPQLPASQAPAPVAKPPSRKQRSNALSVIVNGIQNNAAPATVATAFVNALKRGDPSVVEALKQHNGDVEALARAKLGPWVATDTATRLPYLKSVMEALDAKAKAAGLLAEDDVPPAVETQAPQAAQAPPSATQAAPPPLAPAEAPEDTEDEAEDEEAAEDEEDTSDDSEDTSDAEDADDSDASAV